VGNQRYLILGGSGIVGRALFHKLGPEQAVATFCQRPIPGGSFFDLRSMRLTDPLLPKHPALTHAFVLSGITNIDACARNLAESTRVNVEGVQQIIDDLVSGGITPIFASSDAVFDGSRGGWTEADAPNPILTYGRQKLQVESYLAGKHAPYAVARLSKVVSTNPDEDHLLSEWMRCLERGDVIRAAHDQVFSPIDVDDAVAGMLAMANKQLTGLYHLAGPDRCSRLELLQALINAVRPWAPLDNPNVVRCSIRDFPFIEARPLDASLSSARLQSAAGLSITCYDTICRRFAANRFATARGKENVS